MNLDSLLDAEDDLIPQDYVGGHVVDYMQNVLTFTYYDRTGLYSLVTPEFSDEEGPVAYLSIPDNPDYLGYGTYTDNDDTPTFKMRDMSEELSTQLLEMSDDFDTPTIVGLTDFADDVTGELIRFYPANRSESLEYVVRPTASYFDK